MKEHVITTDSLYDEVCALAEEQGASTQELWNDLVGEVIQAHGDSDEFSPSQNIDELSSGLKERFEEYQEEAAERAHALDEELADVGEDNTT
jgi:hypothetical protein